MKKRLLSLLLTAAMLLSLVPAFAVADNAAGTASGENSAIIEVDRAWCKAGRTVDVNVLVKENPGILGAILDFTFDPRLTLVDAKEGNTWTELTMTKPGTFTSPARFAWDGIDVDRENIHDGVILTLTFEVAEDVDPETVLNVDVSYKYGSIYDADGQYVTLETEGSGIRVLNYQPGDINDDTFINPMDVTLIRRYITGGYTLNKFIETAANVNEDTFINTMDTTCIRRSIAGGYGTILYPALVVCEHELQATAAKAPTCTEDGNIDYWYCPKCNMYFKDANATAAISEDKLSVPATGHTLVPYEYIAPTYESWGQEGGLHCSACDYVEQEPTVLPKLEKKTHSIIYHLDGDGNNAQLVKLNAEGKIINHADNTPFYYEGEGIDILGMPTAPGFTFEGWFNAAGDKVTTIPANSTKNYELYARWTPKSYNVIFKYDTELEGLIDTSRMKDKTYVAGQTTALPILYLSGYSFVGWSDEDGNVCKQIEADSVGERTFYANWVSFRNRAWTKNKLDAPYIYTDDETIVFCYEIGKVENVPIYTVQDFGFINASGISETVERSVTVETSEALVNAYSSTIEKSTTGNATWTLSDGWTDSISIDEEYAESQGKTVEKIEEESKTETGSWYVNTTRGGEYSKITFDTTDEYDLETTTDNTKTYETTDTTEYASSSNLHGFDVNAEVRVGNDKTMWGGSVSGGYENKTTDKSGTDTVTKDGTETDEGGGTQTGNIKHTGSNTTNSSNWSNGSGQSGEEQNEKRKSIAEQLSREISQKRGIGQSYLKTGESSSSQGLSNTNVNTDIFSSEVTYSKKTSEGRKETFSTGAAATGFHRWVMTATSYVFAMIEYDIANNSYSVSTYSIMDDDYQKFQDYSYKTGAYNDNQISTIDFVIPSEITEYVEDRVLGTRGLEYNLDGIVTGYTELPNVEYDEIEPWRNVDYDLNGEVTELPNEEYAEDPVEPTLGPNSYILIPKYVSIDNGDGTKVAVKVTGIAETTEDEDGNLNGVFTGNENLTGVYLSEFITEIPDNAFSGCTHLWDVAGMNISKIGKNAFAGCDDLNSFEISSNVKELGINAFTATDFLEVDAANPSVVQAALASGAKEIVIGVQNMEGTLDNMTLTVPEGTECFTLRGYDRTFHNLRIVSHADVTKLNRVNISSDRDIPLELYSGEVNIAQCTIEAPVTTMELLAAHTELGLYGASSISSEDNTILARDVNIINIDEDRILQAKLNLSGNIVTCGAVTDSENLLAQSDGEVITVDADIFEKMLKPYIVTFDAVGGTASFESKIAYDSDKIGTLPTVTRSYYEFEGWYTAAEGGDRVTSDTVMTFTEDTTIYAHWKRVRFTLSFDPAGGSCAETSREVDYMSGVGSLPTATRDYFGFAGWYTADGSQKSDNFVYDYTKDIMLTARWTPNQYTATWQNGTGYTISVSRTASPYANAVCGELPSGAAVYYGDVLQINYNATTGFNLGNCGETGITVTGDVDSNKIWGSASPKSYSVSWNTGTGYSISVSRTSSPYIGAQTGSLSSGSTVYYGDVLSISYSAWTGYSLSSKGSTSVTVTGNVGSGTIYASASPNSYTYNFIFASTNGTVLGSRSETRTFGSSTTVTPPGYSGYDTPSAQSVTWNTAYNRDIYFYYSPSYVATEQSGSSGKWIGRSWYTWRTWVQYQNRTATTVDVRIRCVETVAASYGYGYNSYLTPTINGTKYSEYTLSSGSSKTLTSKERNLESYSPWYTINVGTTNATTVSISAKYRDSNGNESGSGTWSSTLNIPAY